MILNFPAHKKYEQIPKVLFKQKFNHRTFKKLTGSFLYSSEN